MISFQSCSVYYICGFSLTGVDGNKSSSVMACAPLANGVLPAKTVRRSGSAFPEVAGPIAAIDFGTVNVSLAYSAESEQIFHLCEFTGGHTRVPTILLVREDGYGESFGERARTDYNLYDCDEKKSCHFFQHVKLALSPEKVTRTFYCKL